MAAFAPALFKKGRAAVLGLGRSGLEACGLLSSKGFKVVAWDVQPRSALADRVKKLRRGVVFEGGGRVEKILRCSFAVKSPGIPSHAPVLARLKESGIPVFSELEVALAFCRSKKIVAVTGTNGKSTTTWLLGAIFKAAGKRVHVGGNVGIPLTSLVKSVKENDVLVLETSSYQLEDSQDFHPRAAAILNITADHIDHHGDMDSYIRAKGKIFRSQTAQDWCVFNAADPLAVKLSRECPSRRLFFSLERQTHSDAWLHKGRIVLRAPGAKREVGLTPPSLPGSHNIENAMAAALLASCLGVKPAAIQNAFRGFKGVEHRLEDCGQVRGIACVNDSKATNVESTLTALKAMPPGKQNILLILGGLHKGYPYTPLSPLIEARVKGILTIGSSARKIEEDLALAAPIFPCQTLEVAVKTALQIGSKGDTLLLSPACASFDQFRDFEHRGRRFKELVVRCRKELGAK